MIADVRPVEAGDDQPFVRDAELGEDVGAGAGVGGCGQGKARDLAARVEERPKLAIIGAEVMPPFADAMGFVDGDQRQRRAVDQPPERVGRRPFGRDIEQVELARAEPLDRPLAVRIGRGQRHRTDSHRLGRADLIVHQRDQRRDDQRRPVADQRRQLVA